MDPKVVVAATLLARAQHFRLGVAEAREFLGRELHRSARVARLGG